MVDLSARLEVFQEFLDCVGKVGFLTYDGNGLLLSTNSTNPELYSVLFSAGSCREAVLTQAGRESLPMIVSDSLSMTWLAVPRKVEDVVVELYIVGPVLPSSISEQEMRKRIQELTLPPDWKKAPIAQLQKIPVISHQLLFQFAIMLYRCVYGETLTIADIRLLSSSSHTQEANSPFQARRNLSYAFQQEILKAVADGNIAYVHPQAALFIPVGTMSTEGPLRQTKNMMISFITLITRAAIQGGMPVEAAYDMSDAYILASESCTGITDVCQNAMNALKDFTRRVHDLKSSGYSKAVVDCMAYLHQHVRQPVSLADMAAEVGYNKNYLGAKFKDETGMTPGQFLMAAKMELASVWLRDSRKSIQDICRDLGFESVSYFGTQFKKAYGCSPGQYRVGAGRQDGGR